MPPKFFEYLLGAAIILISFWFLLEKSQPDLNPEKSHELGVRDGLVGSVLRILRRFPGMGGPPLVAYLGSKFDKELFRAIAVPVFLMAATSRILSYSFLGMMPAGNPWLYVFPPLGEIAGNHIGNYFFEDVEQQGFTVLIGIILTFSGIRLLIG